MSSIPTRSDIPNRKLYTYNSDYLALIALIIVYVVSRTYNLMTMPPFVDETIHIMYAHDTLHGQILAGLWDGRFLAMKFMALFVALPFSPLMMVRVASIGAGLATLITVVLIGKQLFSWRTGLLAGLLLTLFPFIFFYDRVALADGFETLFGALTILFSILSVRSNKLRYVVILPIIVLAAILSKVAGVFFVAIPILAVFFFIPRNQWRAAFVRVVPIIIAVAALIALFIWRQDGGIWQFGSKTLDGSVSIVDIILRNIRIISEWGWMLLTPPVFVLVVVALVLSLVSQPRRINWFLLLTIAVTTSPIALGAQIIFSRYLLFAFVPISLLVANILMVVGREIKKRLDPLNNNTANILVWGIVGIVVLALVIWPLQLNWAIATDLQDASLPEELRNQFVSGWPSGYGATELADYLQNEAQKTPGGVNIVRLFYWDVPYLGLDLYVQPSDQLRLYTFNPKDAAIRGDINNLIKQGRTFLILNPKADSDISNSMDEVWWKNAVRVQKFERPGNITGLEVWELKSVE